MKNRVRENIEARGSQVLSIYTTAGYPHLMSMIEILRTLEENSVDFVEVGMPFSDPMADGQVIQKTSGIALKNGMQMQLLFDQVREASLTRLPCVWMGYLNQVLQYGITNFLEECNSANIDTVIIPDLPVSEFEKDYKAVFEKHGVSLVFMISPKTSDKRIRKIDSLSYAFIYVVSDSSITGGQKDISPQQLEYFKRIKEMQLSTPLIIGFGIRNHNSFMTASNYASGAIIGSAFLNHIHNSKDLSRDITQFCKAIRN